MILAIESGGFLRFGLCRDANSGGEAAKVGLADCFVCHAGDSLNQSGLSVGWQGVVLPEIPGGEYGRTGFWLVVRLGERGLKDAAALEPCLGGPKTMALLCRGMVI